MGRGTEKGEAQVQKWGADGAQTGDVGQGYSLLNVVWGYMLSINIRFITWLQHK